MNLHPTSPPPGPPTLPPGAEAYFDRRHEVYQAGDRLVGAVHWSFGEGRAGSRLPAQDTQNGDLRWVKEGVERTLVEVMEASPHEGIGWKVVPDWSVSPSGSRLLCIAGSFQCMTPRSVWYTGRLFEIDLEQETVSMVHETSARTDEALWQCHHLGEDEVLMLAARGLVWLRRQEDGQWAEVVRKRVAGAEQLVVGVVGDTRTAIVRCVSKDGLHKTHIFAISGDRIDKLGEALEAVWDIRVDEGQVKVNTNEGWHRVELPAVTTSKTRKNRTAKPQTLPHPLYKATIEISKIPVEEKVDHISEALRELIGSSGPSYLAPRMCGPEVAAGYADGLLRVWRAGEVVEVELPEGFSLVRFDVSADGRHVWIMGRSSPTQRSNVVLETSVEAPEWRPIEIGDVGLWGVNDIAQLGDNDHLVARVSDSIELLRRTDDGWVRLHRTKCPADAALRPFPHQRCVVLTTFSLVRLYGRKGDKLQKLAEGKFTQKFSGIIPSSRFTSEGVLLIETFHRVDISPAHPVNTSGLLG